MDGWMDGIIHIQLFTYLYIYNITPADGESDSPQEEDPEVEWQDFSTEQMLSIIASRTRTQVFFWMGNQMANLESLIDTTM